VNNKYKFQTTKDGVHLVWDTRDGRNHAYLVVGQEVYLFEGVEKMSAVGLKNSGRASVPSGRLGEFYMLADLNRVPTTPERVTRTGAFTGDLWLRFGL